MDNQVMPQAMDQPQPVSVESSAQGGQPKPKFPLLAALLFLLLGGIGGFFVSKYISKPTQAPQSSIPITPTRTTDPTANWKIYTSDSLGFSISYPDNIQVNKEFNDQYNKGTSFSGENIEFEIMLRKQPNELDLNNYNYMDSKPSRTTSVAEQIANIYESPNGYCDGPSCSKPYITIVTLHKQNFYHITFNGDTKLSNIESQILSTFKFVDQTDETINWKTYTNNQYGFSLNYPEEFSLTDSSGTNVENLSIASASIIQYKQGKKTTFSLSLDSGLFNLESLKRYAPTGQDNILPEYKKFGNTVTYYYGAGGGGVCYPDQFFINLNNKILIISFYEPECEDKTPSSIVKTLESQVLSTFKLLK